MIDSKHIGASYNFFVFKDEISVELTQGLLKTTEKLMNTKFSDKNSVSDKLQAQIYSGEQFSVPEVMLDQSLLSIIEKNIDLYIKELSSNTVRRKNSKLSSFWSVIQRAGDYNTVHYHKGTLSGILYLKVPSEVADETNPNGKLNFIHGEKDSNRLVFNGIRRIIPKPGDLYIFPSWLHHTVYPFKGDGDRISVAFNYDIELEEIN